MNDKRLIELLTSVRYTTNNIEKVAEEIITLFDGVRKSEQLCDRKCKPMVNADWTYLRCECGKRFEPKG